MSFGWPEQPLWPGETRVLSASGGQVNVRVRCLGPGEVTVVDASSVSRTLPPEEELSTLLPGDGQILLVNALGGSPTAVSVDCEVAGTVRLSFEEATGGGTAPASAGRADFSGDATLRPGEQLVFLVAGDQALTTFTDPPGAALHFEGVEPIDEDQRLEFANQHVFRGEVHVRVSVEATPAGAFSVLIRDAVRWSVHRVQDQAQSDD